MGSAIALLAALAAACAPSEGAPPAHAVGESLDADERARGERLFLGSCAGYCHVPPGGGRGDAPDLFDCRWLYGAADEAIFRSISDGVPDSDMEGFAGSLSASDRWLLVGWLQAESRCDSAGPGRVTAGTPSALRSPDGQR